jgi:hypothetical protein
MRFKTKFNPELWDRKTIIQFAWLPTKIENTIIWLEKYECTYGYTHDLFWEYNYWEVIDKKLINKQD